MLRKVLVANRGAVAARVIRALAHMNIASVDALAPSCEGQPHYTASKHALAGLTKALSAEWAPRGIRVNAVCPGASMTEGAVALVAAGAPDGIDLAAQWSGIAARTRSMMPRYFSAR